MLDATNPGDDLPGRPLCRCGLTCLAITLVLASGCVEIGVKERALDRHLGRRLDAIKTSFHLSDTTRGALRRESLPRLVAQRPAETYDLLLHRASEGGGVDPAMQVALAEMALNRGSRSFLEEPAVAAAWYRQAAVHATDALAALPSPATDPTAADALVLANRAIERLIVLAQNQATLRNVSWQSFLVSSGLTLGSTTPELSPSRFAEVRPASQFLVTGLAEVYRGPGLGVPVVAKRENDAERSTNPQDHFYGKIVEYAATAVLHVDPSPSPGAPRRLTLVFHDPFAESRVDLAGRAVPMAYDRTTPLAVQVDEGNLSQFATLGLLRPQYGSKNYGVYMLRSYKPGRIPVVLVHGLHSSPETWVKTLNVLRNDPDLERRYQFWFFMYPTGEPIAISQARLRESLRKVRDTLDPQHTDAAFDKMVLVGHSMGGILSRLMAADSGTVLWDGAFRVPYGSLRASPPTLAKLESSLIFRPEPYVSRVICIAAPHRGAPVADEPISQLASRFILPSPANVAMIDEIRHNNGPEAIRPELLRRKLTSINALSPSGLATSRADALRVNPKVPLHSIIPQMGIPGTAITFGSDGVVPYWSSHLDDARSEIVVHGTHTAHTKPEVTGEIRRILLTHLAETAPLPGPYDPTRSAAPVAPAPDWPVAAAPGDPLPAPLPPEASPR